MIEIMARARSDTESANRQVHQYDKVLRENMEAALPGVMENVLHIDATHTEELPDDIQHTKERNPDVLKKVTDNNGSEFVLHVEWQIANESEMAFRMAEYYIMLLRRYQIPVRQYVIYMGKGLPRMVDHIRTEHMHFKYELIAFSTVDYRILLRRENPEEKMLAILADFGDSDPLQVVATITKDVVAASKGSFAILRYLKQLGILSQLRNLESENEAAMESIKTWFKLENDAFYRIGKKRGIEKGIEKGEEKKAREFVRALLRNTNHTIPEIARLVNVTEYFVRKVKRSL